MNLAPKSFHKDFTEEDRNDCLSSAFVLFFAALVFFGGLGPANETVLHQEALKETITRIALEYHVDPKLALFMAEQESTFRPDALGDMDIICPHTGKPVRSRGLYQISECYYPDFSDADAFDPEINIRKAMEIVSEGKANCISQFSSCRRYYSIDR